MLCVMKWNYDELSLQIYLNWSYFEAREFAIKVIESVVCIMHSESMT